MKRRHADNLSRFNYNELVDFIEKITSQHPYVKTVIKNRYTANGAGDILYPAIAITVGEIRIEERQISYAMNLLYVDRQTESRDNTTYIHSVGITTLTEIINAIKKYGDSIDSTQAVLNVFTGQFADGTAGVVANTTLTTIAEIGECEWFCPQVSPCK